MFDPEKPLNTPLNEEGLTKMPFPKLDKYDFEVAQLMANIYICSRELAQRNLTDNEHFTLDKAVDEMVDCVNRFEDQVRKLIQSKEIIYETNTTSSDSARS